MFTFAGMYFPHEVQVGRGKCEHKQVTNFGRKLIILCRNKKPSAIVDSTNPHC